MMRLMAIGSKTSASQLPKLSDTDLNIVFDGNSLTEGINGAGIDQYFPKEIQTWLTGKVQSLQFFSDGIGGQRLTTMLANAPTKIDPLVDNNKTNLLVVNEDANDLLQSFVTAQQNYDNMQSYINGRYTAGYDYVILWTGWYPRLPYDLFVPTQQALDYQHDYFNLVQSNPIGNKVVDMRNAPNIGGGREQNQNATYFNDYLHLLAAGYDIVADEIINKGILKIFDL